MRLITSQELSQRTDQELQALFNSVSKALVLTNADTPARRNALATLENIERMRASRNPSGPRL